MTMALAAITYLDRVAIGVTRPYIARDLDLTPTQMGYVFSAFYLSYALFEIPTGWWGDKVGTRRVLTRIVCWWSAFTVLTGFAFNYPSLLAIRFLFGAGEAGAWPNVARTFSRWFPRRERGTVQGIFFMGAHLAGGLTPLLATALLAYMDWRTLFVRLRIDRVRLGARMVSMVSRHAGRTSRRSARPSAPSSKTAKLHRRTPALETTQWKRLLANRTVVCLCLMYFTQTFGNAFYVTWLPTYLASRGLSGVATAAILSGLPLTLSVVADLTGGITTDHGRPGGSAFASAASSSAAGRLPRRACSRLGLVRRIAHRRSRADRPRRRFVELPARIGMGNVSRHRRAAGRGAERRHEHVGPGRRDPQPDPHRVRVAAIPRIRTRRST